MLAKAAGKEPSDCNWKQKKMRERWWRKELPADFITYPCLPPHIWNQNLDTDNVDIQRGLLLFIHSKRVVEISTHEAALVGSLGIWKSQGLHYPACRWPCIWPSSGRINIFACDNGIEKLHVICAASRNLSGTCWYKETMALIKFQFQVSSSSKEIG